jgi:thioredoxin-related protein
MRLIAILLSVVCVVPLVAQENPQPVADTKIFKSIAAQHLARDYDPRRDPAADLKLASEVARKSGKRLLVIVGGNWCTWCDVMDTFFGKNPDITRLRDTNYVTVKVNFSPENKNQKFLAQFPPIHGYPHIFVLDENGKLIQSEATNLLEHGKGYDKKKFSAFLERYAPSQATQAAAK